MKKQTRFQRLIPSAVFGLIVAGSVGCGLGQTFTNIPITMFDTASDPYVMVDWWGGVVFSSTWDGTQNATTTLVPTNAGSGALMITADWTGTSGVSGNPQPQLELLGGLAGGWGGWNPSLLVNGFYYDLDFDIMFDPSSARSAANGSFGTVNAQLAFTGWNGGDNQTVWSSGSGGFTNLGWYHVHAYIDPTLPKVDSIAGFALQLPWQTWTGNTNVFYTNASQAQTLWLDNIIFTTNLNKPLKPPTLKLTPVAPTPGLSIQTTSTAGGYDRDSIATVSGNYSWVGAGSTPVTYSVKIGKYPGKSYPGFQTHIFLVSGANGSLPGTESSPDWNEANCVFLQIQNNADGSAFGRFMWKTNDANDNAMLWNTQFGGAGGTANTYAAGTIGTLYEPAGVLGTWSISFVNDTNVTLTSPSGLSTNFFFPDDLALQTYFPQGSVAAYFGGQPNGTANIGQGIVLAEVKINGSSLTPIDDQFTESVLDPTVWVIREAQSTAVALVQNNVHWNLGWTLPDLHFQLQSAASVLGPWTDAGIATNAVQSGASKSLLLPDTALPSKNAGYFRMVKRVATKLQVLMPGETAAPNTPTGKTGTPTSFNVGDEVDVIVNAVDKDWNIIPTVTDTVSITATDPNPFTPPNAALANGTGTFAVYFYTSNDTSNPTWTVTATDVTDSTKAANTGSPIVIH